MTAERQTPFGEKLAATARAFWEGFCQPSLPALMLMACAAIGAAGLMLTCVTPQTLAGSIGQYVPRATKDNEAFATVEAFRLAYNPSHAPNSHHLTLIGNSIVAQAFASDSDMAKDLQAATRQPWSVSMLTTPYQGALDEAALADYATRQVPGIVVMSMGFDRFGQTREDYLHFYKMARVGLRSDWTDDQVRTILHERPRRRTGIYVVDNRKFLLLNATSTLLRFLVQTPADRRIDSYIRTDGTHEMALRYRGEIIRHLHNSYRPNQLAIDLVALTVKRLQERGARVIFFEAPMSDDIFTRPSDRRLYNKYLAASPKVARDLGAYYCRPPASAQPPASVFPDYFHIAEPYWQQKQRHALANCVTDMMRKHEQAS